MRFGILVGLLIWMRHTPDRRDSAQLDEIVRRMYDLGRVVSSYLNE